MSKRGRKPIIPVKAGTGKNIQLYVLEEGAIGPKKGNHASTELLKTKLKPLINRMDVRNQTIPVDRKSANTVRKWLTNEFSHKAFRVYKVLDNKDVMRIIRIK